VLMSAALHRVVLKTLLFTVAVPGTVTVVIPYLLLAPRAQFEVGYVTLLGAVVIGLGVVIFLRCTWDFAFQGLGTPAPIDPPKLLVAKGLYRYLRNPMYVGVELIVLGQAILFQSRRLVIYAAVVALGFHLFVILYEEPELRRKFGASYEEYCKTVPRWIPRFSKA
jgi:protein-S-isoprenylcysteine O-methyltransferase Ste14